MKIPNKLKAFGRTYKIIRNNDITNTMECLGYLDAMKDIIVLKKRNRYLTPGHERQIFLHELLHVIDSNFHVGVTEDQIQILAVGLSTILDDNKLDFTDGK